MQTSTKATVVARREGKDVVFAAGRFTFEEGYGPYWCPLRWSDEVEVTFATFAEAERVVRDYNDGPGEEVRAAHWNSEAGEWVVTEVFRSPGRSDREDFHADG